MESQSDFHPAHTEGGIVQVYRLLLSGHVSESLGERRRPDVAIE